MVVAVVACLGLLRGADASTLTWDWGNEAYQRRAGNILSAIRDDLSRQHPVLPPYSRVYFGHIPNNVGLVAGQSPAVRVWYGDSTLYAGFFSYYRPRAESEPPGKDYFFRFDSTRGMVEVKAGPEDVRSGVTSNAEWESDHEKLAVLFLESRDVRRAAVEFEKLSELRSRADAAGFAAVCWEVAGDSARAESLITRAQSRLRLTDDEVRLWVTRLKASFPGR
jgi:hypothetical protein